jgi:hypothetical protein
VICPNLNPVWYSDDRRFASSLAAGNRRSQYVFPGPPTMASANNAISMPPTNTTRPGTRPPMAIPSTPATIANTRYFIVAMTRPPRAASHAPKIGDAHETRLPQSVAQPASWPWCAPTAAPCEL